jgi:hypothetical protein
VFLQDATQFVGIQAAVPDPIRIDNQPWTSFANTEAGGFRAKHRHGKFSRFGFKDTPEGFADGWIATIRADAEEQVSRRSGDFLQRHLRIGGIALRRIHRWSIQPLTAADELSIGIQLKIADTTSPVWLLETLSTFSLSPDLVKVTRIVPLCSDGEPDRAAFW